MKIIHDYEQMPPLYRSIYYAIRFDSGKDLHRNVTKIIKGMEKKTSPDELELIKQFLLYKYDDSSIHPKYQDISKYIGKTKSSTTVEIRKSINNVICSTEFVHAFSKEEVRNIKEVFKILNDEIIKEIESLALTEENRISTYQKEAPKRKRIGSEVNRKLSVIAPKIIEETKNKSNFFTKLRFSKRKIGFFIMPDVGKTREIIVEYLEKSKKSERLFIELEDETENYFVTFSEHVDLAFMDSILAQQFNKGPIEGFKILGIPIQVIIERCQYKGMEICKPEWHELKYNTYYESIKNGIFAFNNRLQIKEYTADSIRFVKNELMKETKFDSELHLACYLHYNFLLPMQTYVIKREEYFEKNDISMSTEEFKSIKENIYKELLLSGKVNSKWKNEMDLFKLVSKYYPDSMYQYRTDWLDRQSLDIFIPSLKIGIEYQGIQHYEPISFFGGEEALLYRQKLDDLKAEKCKENGVRLIHWHYQDIITKRNLTNKINQV